MLKGSKKENDKAEVFKFRLTRDEREKLKKLAEEKNCSSGELLRRFINDEYIKSWGVLRHPPRESIINNHDL